MSQKKRSNKRKWKMPRWKWSRPLAPQLPAHRRIEFEYEAEGKSYWAEYKPRELEAAYRKVRETGSALQEGWTDQPAGAPAAYSMFVEFFVSVLIDFDVAGGAGSLADDGPLTAESFALIPTTFVLQLFDEIADDFVKLANSLGFRVEPIKASERLSNRSSEEKQCL